MCVLAKAKRKERMRKCQQIRLRKKRTQKRPAKGVQNIQPKARWICLLRLAEKCFILHFGFDNMIYWLVCVCFFPDCVLLPPPPRSSTLFRWFYRRLPRKIDLFYFRLVNPFSIAFRLQIDSYIVRAELTLAVEFRG